MKNFIQWTLWNSSCILISFLDKLQGRIYEEYKKNDSRLVMSYCMYHLVCRITEYSVVELSCKQVFVNFYILPVIFEEIFETLITYTRSFCKKFVYKKTQPQICQNENAQPQLHPKPSFFLIENKSYSQGRRGQEVFTAH